MPKPIHFLVAVISVVLVGIDTPSADAQNLRSRQPLQFGPRWLGQGWSAGYHHRDPGPNTDYYNPYTAHNSMLISKQPGYQSAQHQYYNHPMTQGVPYSVYAPTSGNSTNWNYGHGQGQSIQPTFVPSGDSDEDADEEDDDTDNDFDVSDMDDMPNISSDPNEPGSIRVDEDSADADMDDQDADFEESSTDDGDDAEFDDEKETDDASINATKAGYSRRAPESLESMDFNSFMVN